MTHFSVYSSSFYEEILSLYRRRIPALRLGASLHAHLVVRGWSDSARLSAKLIAFYAHHKHLPIARKVFDRIPKSDVRVWVAMVGSLARSGYCQEAISVYDEMQNAGFKHDRFALPSVLKACAHLSDQRTGTKLHAVVVKSGFLGDEFIISALIGVYSKSKEVEIARQLFDLKAEKDLVSLNAMASGYVQNGFLEEAFSLVREMKISGANPDIETWNSLISGFSQAGDEATVAVIFETMIAAGVKPDVVSWTSLISGLVQNLLFKKAYRAFKRMLQSGVSPTAPTVSALLPAAGSVADTRRGREIHGYSVVAGLQDDAYVRSALTDMYAKGGFIAEALSLFNAVSEETEPTTVACNSMIFSYANHGLCEEAMELFNRMAKEGRKLDNMTFSAALAACVHGVMVDAGKRLFQMMGEYGIVPRPEHYASMVDLLGKAGRVDEAYEYIQRMPIEPDSFVWGAFLGACRQHGFVDLAERAAEELAKMEPNSSGSTTVLAGLYADSSRWKEAMEVKQTTRNRKLNRFRSRSWIS